MKLAFYCGTKSGLSGAYNKGVRWIEDGDFSHVEAIFEYYGYISGSSSFMDGGVRFKHIDYSKHPSDWVIVDIPWADEKAAYKYIDARKHKKYDIKGNVHFLIGLIKNNGEKEFCSGLLAGAIGIEKPWQYAPNSLYEIVTFINKQFERQQMLNLATDGDDGTDTGNGNPPDKPPTKPPVTPIGG